MTNHLEKHHSQLTTPTRIRAVSSAKRDSPLNIYLILFRSFFVEPNVTVLIYIELSKVSHEVITVNVFDDE